jgi:hypothetical protein
LTLLATFHSFVSIVFGLAFLAAVVVVAVIVTATTASTTRIVAIDFASK